MLPFSNTKTKRAYEYFPYPHDMKQSINLETKEVVTINNTQQAYRSRDGRQNNKVSQLSKNYKLIKVAPPSRKADEPTSRLAGSSHT